MASSNTSQQGMGKGLTLYAHLLPDADKKADPPGTIVAAPVLYTEEQKAAQQAKIDAGRFAPNPANYKRQQMLAAQQAKNKKKTGPTYGPPRLPYPTSATTSSSSPDKPAASNSTQRPTFADFAETKPEDIDSYNNYLNNYQPHRGRGGQKNKNKRKYKEFEPEPLNLDMPHDPKRSHRYQAMKPETDLEGEFWDTGFYDRLDPRIPQQVANVNNGDAAASTTANNPISGQRESRPAKADFAKRMLAKMGHIEGQGLGAHGQGIITPLSMQTTKKTGNKGGMGRIVGGKKSKEHRDVEDEKSEVILVLGMLDDVDLEADAERNDGGIRQEIGDTFKDKYGVISRIYFDYATEDRAVFFKFGSQLAAFKAMEDFKKPEFHFQQNKCQAAYYDAEKFEAGIYDDYVKQIEN